jgi:hypothetical protein
VNKQTRQWPSDELYHWKYIKREKKNGKWVYYYDNPEENKVNSRYNVAEKRQLRAGSNLGFSMYQKNELENKYRNIAGPMTPEDHQKNNIINARMVKEQKEYDDADRELDKAHKARANMYIKTLAPKAITKGLNAISSLIDKLKKRKK